MDCRWWNRHIPRMSALKNVLKPLDCFHTQFFTKSWTCYHWTRLPVVLGLCIQYMPCYRSISQSSQFIPFTLQSSVLILHRWRTYIWQSLSTWLQWRPYLSSFCLNLNVHMSTQLQIKIKITPSETKQEWGECNGEEENMNSKVKAINHVPESVHC